jgi:hypothetical protein
LGFFDALAISKKSPQLPGSPVPSMTNTGARATNAVAPSLLDIARLSKNTYSRHRRRCSRRGFPDRPAHTSFR